MEPTFNFPAGLSKAERYGQFLLQFRPFIADEHECVSLLANTSAALKEAFGFFWVGFYLVKDEDWLTLGPFQGSVACYRIRKGRGVCGTAWAQAASQVVPDVDQFPGHIACSSLSRSEIVVPLFTADGHVWGVLDIDSDRPDAFDETDRHYLEQLCQGISEAVFS